MKQIFWISFALFLISTLSMPYTKVIHKIDFDNAKCLDGSPGILYIHEGGEKDKFLIYF